MQQNSNRSSGKRLKNASRPTQSYYVPPAQRSAKKKEEPVVETPVPKCNQNHNKNKSNAKNIFDKKEQANNEHNLIQNIKPSKTPLYISLDGQDEKSNKCSKDRDNDLQDIIPHVNKRHSLVKQQDVKSVTKVTKSTRLEEDAETNKDINLVDWEDMLDENGELETKYFKEIIKDINEDVKERKTSVGCNEQQSNNTNQNEELEHVIELYDFPASFKTQDLVQLYSTVYNTSMYVRWCDDTHALLVLGTPLQAQRALQLEHQMIKSRPLSEASSIAKSIACNLDLKPAMQRPPTNMQTARRLINIHLGTKSALQSKTAEQERIALREAREQKRLEKQNERDAWEGNLKSAK